MRARRWVTVAMIGVIATFGLAACGGGEDAKNEGQSIARGFVASSKTGDPRFDPEQVTAPLNQEVSFSVTNEDDREHNFTISQVFVDADHFVEVNIPPGQSRAIRITIRDRGRDGFIPFVCRFHESAGMTGKIIVR